MIKVLSIVDSYSWALYNRAVSLKKHLPKFNFTIKHFDDLENVNFNKFDVIYVLNWPIHGKIHKKISGNRKYRIITTVSSHIGRPKAKDMASLFNRYDAISTSSKFLFNEFSPIYKKKVFYTPFGVESELFLPKTKPSEFPKVFGWVGSHHRPVKRFKNIEKVIKSLGSDFVLKTAKQSDGFSREEMVDFYNSIGTLICFSKSEGTPNPVIEAASCGRAIISTSVGNVPQLLKNDGWVISNEKQLKSSILLASKSPLILDAQGLALRKNIEKRWDWSNRSKRFIKFISGDKHV
jgi:glycosyltransferase involved in cell wall biosynthesis